MLLTRSFFRLKVAMRLKTITFFLLFFAHSLSGKVLIWDLGFTLIEPNNFKIARKLGLIDCIAMYLIHGDLSYNVVNDSLYDIFMDGEEDHIACVPCEPEGRLMPNYMCHWFTKEKTSKEILILALKNADKYPDYVSDRHKRIIKKLLNWMLNPRAFAECMRPMYRAPKLLKDCAQKKNAHGKPAHTLYVLSNWDSESFEHLYKNPQNAPIFKHFKPENIYISGTGDYIKPQLGIYKAMIEKYNLDPKECILIDDQSDNVRAARACGFIGVQLKNSNFRELRKKLKKLAVL